MKDPDVTDPELRLEANSERLESVERLTRSGYWEHDVRTGKNWWSDQVYRILGLEPGELPPGQETVDSLVYPEDLPGLRAAYEKAVGSGRLEDFVFRIRDPNGEERRILVTGEVEYGADSAPVVFTGVLVDVTEKTKAEDSARESRASMLCALDALRESEERYRAIVETSTDWIWEIDAKVRNTFSNPAVEAILGYAPEELPDLDAFDLIHADDHDELRARLTRAIERKEGWSDWVLRWQHKDGTYRHLETNARPILDSSGAVIGFRGVDRDITERRRMQERMLHMQKLEAVGQLAAGVAHDFNNQLVSILGHGEFLLESIPADLAEHVEEIRRAGERAAALTSQLLAFGRRQVFRTETFDLNELIDDLGMLLNRLIEAHITLDLSLARDPLVIEADRSQLETIVANLVTNARDAMPDGGTLSIQTQSATFGEDEAALHGLGRPGRYAWLTVRDDGIGMDTATMERVFEPFFTTKRVGEGSGLGLATVYGIVKQSHGEVRIHSEPGRGTEVSVYLPCTEKRSAEQPLASGAPAGGQEHVLVLDDEPSVASTVAMTLKRAGYSVSVATDSFHALELAEAEDIDVLVSDVIMPKMGGIELSRRMQERHPELRVLLISGYSGIDTKALEVDRQSYMSKPFKPREILTRVRELLDS